MAISEKEAAFGLRIAEYLKNFPDDAPAVALICASIPLGAKTVREVVEITAGKPLTNIRWDELKPRWERTWQFIMDTNPHI